MKTIILILLLTLSVHSSLHAEILTPVDVIIKQGLQVRMGELTGAGSKFSLSNMQGLILPEGVLMKSDCTGIVVKNTSDPKVSDIVKIKVQDQEIAASEFVGFVTK